jgi:SAM-dependent methyltransferase
MEVEPLPWDFAEIVGERARRSPDLLDLGTGGGEWLAGLPHRPPRVVATEPWPRNVPVARERLEPLGVEVVEVEAASDNVEQRPGDIRGRLPLPDSSFHLVVSRHEAFVAAEVARVLSPGGRFLTQQLGSGGADFARLLGSPTPRLETFKLELAVRQLEDAGFQVLSSSEGEERLSFRDVGALAWYLKAVPWTVPGFDLQTFRARLRGLHDAEAPLKAGLYAFWLDAARE